MKEVKTIAADGTEQVAKTLEEASSKNFSGLLQGWKKEADKGVLGTFSTLVSAVKSKDWEVHRAVGAVHPVQRPCTGKPEVH